MQEWQKKTMVAHYIDCVDCAHCVDLHSPKESDPKELTEARIDA